MKFSDVQFSPRALKEIQLHEWVLRFAFGGAISLASGLIGEKWGLLVGGLFLAFPSIMPATVTLLKKHKGREDCIRDAFGSIFGSVGLIVFALVMWLTTRASIAAPWCFSLSSLAWLIVSVALWRAFSGRGG